MEGEEPFPEEEPEAVELATGPDADFLRAKNGYEFDGQVLQPWTPPRIFAAQAMGMLFPLIGEEGSEQLDRTGVYAGALKDTVIFLWLSVLLAGESVPAAQSRALRSERKPQQSWAEAQKWAEKKGLLDLAGEPFMAAYNIFSSKMAAKFAAEGKPDAPTAGASGSDQKKSDSSVLGGIPHDGSRGDQ